MPKAMIQIDISELEEYSENFDKAVKGSAKAIKDIVEYAAKPYLNDLIAATPVKTGQLKAQWKKDNPVFRVQEDGDNYWVELVNTTSYAEWVEKGHHSYNQFGGPYIVKNRTVPYYSGGSGPTFVYGRFFVKRTEVDWDSGKLDKLANERFLKWLQKTLEGG